MNNSKNMSFNKKHKHLTYKDRSIIQEFLTYGHSFTTIGKRIHKDRTTIAKEVKHHRFVRYCSGRRTVVCNKLSKAPYVCNGCNLLVTCRQPKYLYDAAVADHEYRSTLSSTRSRLRLTKSQIADINEVISPLMMLMYGKEASNRKQEIDRQHYTIPNQRPKDKHCGKI